MGVKLSPSERKKVDAYTAMVVKARPQPAEKKSASPAGNRPKKGKVPPQLAAYAAKKSAGNKKPASKRKA